MIGSARIGNVRVSGRSFAAAAALLLLVAYAGFGGVWRLGDLVSALRLVALLWLPPAVLLYGVVRRECLDATEALVLSAVGGLTLATVLSFGFSTLGVAVPALQPYWPAPFVLCGVLAVLRVGKWIRASRSSRSIAESGSLDARAGPGRVDWTLIALVVGSLCVTARYQRPFAAGADEGGARFVLNGDQSFFTSVAHELQRGSPPAQNPMRAGARQAAYHHLPHATLALAGSVAGEEDLLHLNLTILYSTLVALHVLLVFCMGRRLAGTGAGWLAAWLLFLAAVPLEPLGSGAFSFFFFAPFPHATSTIEPTLLASPQMFYGLIPGVGALLGLLIAWRNLAQGRPAMGVATLAACLVAVTMRFRVHCFVVLAPAVLGALVMMAWSRRRWRLLVPVALAVVLILLQVVEMRLPVYLPQTQKVSFGVGDLNQIAPFYATWPGAGAAYNGLRAVLGEGLLLNGAWGTLCLSAFLVCNVLGIPMALCVLLFMRRSWRDPGSRALVVVPLLLFVATISAPVVLQAKYDKYSLGGQIPFHFGWYGMPLVAAGLWPLLARLQGRLGAVGARSRGLFWGLTLALVGWQMARGPSPFERRNLAEARVLSADELATIDYMRHETPPDAAILTGVRHQNFALWSGLAARRTILEYFPAGRILDTILPPQDRADARLARIRRLHVTTDAREFASLLRQSEMTHVIEYADRPLALHPPECLRRVYASPSGGLRVWEVL